MPPTRDDGKQKLPNPYQSPSEIDAADTAKGSVWTLIAVASRITANKWMLRSTVVLSAAGCLHFVLSFGLWVYYCNQYWPESPGELWWNTWHIVVLFMISLAAFILALCGRRHSLILLAVFFVASASAFTYDILNENCQIQVSVATSEYWESGGKAQYYLTWWWY